MEEATRSLASWARTEAGRVMGAASAVRKGGAGIQANVSLFLIFHCSDCRAPHYIPLPTFSCLRKGRRSLITGLALVSVEGRLEGRLFCKWSSIPSLPFQ